MKTTNNRTLEQPYKIKEKGSLGLLAYGDIGLRAWRQVKQNNKKINSVDEEE